MRKMTFLLFVLLLAATPALATDAAAPAFDAQAAFDRLAAMAGTWTGTAEGEGEAASQEAEGHSTAVTHEFKVSANGNVVMETMNPGTEHEMINMYHLDGDDLVLTHYCSGGNQPRMRIDAAESTADLLVFDFDGGTNLDPATDGHIHGARISFVGDSVDSVWIPFHGGEQAGQMAFHLTRAE